MSAVLKFELFFEDATCSCCGVTFGLPAAYIRNRRKDHERFYCPNGHNQYFPSKSVEDKLRDELEQERRRTIAAQNQTQMELRQRQKLERKLRRVEKGACPECNRHFVNVERHMKTKHGKASEGK